MSFSRCSEHLLSAIPSLRFSCEPKIVRIGAQFFVPDIGDPKIVFEAKSPAARPIDSRLERQHHALPHSPCAGLVRIGLLVRAGTYSVTDRMGGLSRISAFRDAGSNQPVEFGKSGTVANKRCAFSKNLEKQIK